MCTRAIHVWLPTCTLHCGRLPLWLYKSYANGISRCMLPRAPNYGIRICKEAKSAMASKEGMLLFLLLYCVTISSVMSSHFRARGGIIMAVAKKLFFTTSPNLRWGGVVHMNKNFFVFELHILYSILSQLLCRKMSVKGMIEGISGECGSIFSYLVET